MFLNAVFENLVFTLTFCHEVVAKPFASVYPSELPTCRHPSIRNANILRVGETCKASLTHRVMEKIIGRPECAALVTDLYPGPSFPSPNSYPPTSANCPLMVPLCIDDSLDISRITAIIDFNAFAANPLRVAEFTQTPTDAGPAALHLIPSLFNHACFANIVRYSLGDAIVMHANQDISCGTELTVTYTDSGGNHLTRGQSLVRLLGHEMCDCKLCNLDRADGDGACHKREGILLDHDRAEQALIRRGVNSSSPTLEMAYKNCIHAVESTYAHGRGHLSPSTFFIHVGLSQVYMDRAAEKCDTSLYDDARNSIFASLAAVGIVRKRVRTRDGNYLPISLSNLPVTGTHDDAIIAIVQLAMTYYCQLKFSQAQEWVRAAHWSELQYVNRLWRINIQSYFWPQCTLLVEAVVLHSFIHGSMSFWQQYIRAS
jgi:hypothetical protein